MTPLHAILAASAAWLLLALTLGITAGKAIAKADADRPDPTEEPWDCYVVPLVPRQVRRHAGHVVSRDRHLSVVHDGEGP